MVVGLTTGLQVRWRWREGQTEIAAQRSKHATQLLGGLHQQRFQVEVVVAPPDPQQREGRRR